MNRTDRLTGIVLALRGGRRTVQELADRFEVSRRTILRDISALGEIGVPVITIAGVGGGVEIGEGYWLPPLHLTAAEASVLLLGLQSIGSGAGAPLAPERRSAEEKLRAVLRPDVAGAVSRDLASIAVSPPAHGVAAEVFRTLRAAIEREGWVMGTYQSAQRIAVQTIAPLQLFLEEGRWYCVAVAVDWDGQRRFRLDRFVDLQRCPDPIGASEARAAWLAPAAPYDDPRHPEIVVVLTYSGMRRAEDERGWVDHLTERPGGTWELRYRCPPAEYPFYARLVFALGAEAEAIHPASFREMVKALAIAALDRYEDNHQPHASPHDPPGTVVSERCGG